MRPRFVMPRDFAKQIAKSPPGALTALLLVSVVAQMIASGVALPPVARGALISLPIGLICGWLWAVFNVSRHASLTPISPYWDWIFAVPPAVALAAGLAGWSTQNSPAAFAIFLALFVGLSLAAKTLERVDAANDAPSIGRMLGTAVLMYFAPVGVWVLRGKILRVTARSDDVALIT